jgi:Flp pilus assembly pilin Flp
MRRKLTRRNLAAVLALVVLAMIAGLNAVAGRTTGMWNDVSSDVLNHSGSR